MVPVEGDPDTADESAVERLDPEGALERWRFPGQATEILLYKVYKDGFKALDLGGSAAQSVILMTIVIVLTVVQFRYIERKVQY